MSYLIKKKFLQEDYKIWRYMDFTKFCDLILTESLYFANISLFTDPWECYPSKWMLKGDNWLNILKKNKYLPKEDLEQACKNLVEQIKSTYRNRDQYAASCWHKNDKENEPFWKLYSDHKTGVAIKTSVSSFIQSILAKNPDDPYNEYLPYNIALVPIIYEDYTNLSYEGITEICALQYKRADFAHEKEIRFIVYDHQKKIFPFKLKVDLNLLIEEIKIAPFAEEWFENLINNFLRSNKIQYEAKKSVLYNAPESQLIENKLAISSMPERGKIKNTFALFNNEEEFNIWHKNIKKTLKIPICGRNAATGFIRLDSCLTTGWCEPIYHPDKNDKRVLGIIPEFSLNDNSLKLLNKTEAEKEGFFRYAQLEV